MLYVELLVVLEGLLLCWHTGYAQRLRTKVTLERGGEGR